MPIQRGFTNVGKERPTAVVVDHAPNKEGDLSRSALATVVASFPFPGLYAVEISSSLQPPSLHHAVKFFVEEVYHDAVLTFGSAILLTRCTRTPWFLLPPDQVKTSLTKHILTRSPRLTPRNSRRICSAKAFSPCRSVFFVKTRLGVRTLLNGSVVTLAFPTVLRMSPIMT